MHSHELKSSRSCWRHEFAKIMCWRVPKLCCTMLHTISVLVEYKSGRQASTGVDRSSYIFWCWLQRCLRLVLWKVCHLSGNTNHSTKCMVFAALSKTQACTGSVAVQTQKTRHGIGPLENATEKQKCNGQKCQIDETKMLDKMPSSLLARCCTGQSFVHIFKFGENLRFLLNVCEENAGQETPSSTNSLSLQFAILFDTCSKLL